MSSNKKRKIDEPTMYTHKAAVLAHNMSVSSSSNGQKRVSVSTTQVNLNPITPVPAFSPFPPELGSAETEQTDFWSENGPVPYNPDNTEKLGIKLAPAKRYQNSDAPLRTWLGFRNEQLDERMRYEGRGDKVDDSQCPGCYGVNIGLYRCDDCFGRELVCVECCVSRHWTSPLHRVKIWKDGYFQPVALSSLGVFIQLGEKHPPGSPCIFGLDVHKDFVILHSNGIHSVSIRSCGCLSPDGRVLDVNTQLLRAGLYPATPLEPQTAGTFEAMRLFHIMNLQGKVSAYHFYKSLQYYTDNTGTVKLPDRYRPFTLMARKWRHEAMVKRGARAYDPRADRVEATKQGELAVLCRACPVPGMNLPDGWEDASPEPKDACFRFKNRLRSSDAKDPTLGPGWAYFVDHGPYLEHCKKYATEEEMSTCSGFAALHLANLKGITGHRTSGVGGVCCARQQCWRPNGVGDLQKGERMLASGNVTPSSITISYEPHDTPTVTNTVTSTFASAFLITYLLTVIASYDIVCQWLKGLFARRSRLPPHLQLPITSQQIKGKIPKFHFDAHGKKDHAQYSFNYTKGAGQNEGEGIERNWSYIKSGVGQTVEMGPGGRHDVLDDFFGYCNYRKMTDIGNSLLKKMLKAISEAVTHRRAFEELDAHLKEDRPDQVAKWEAEYAAWDRKPTGSPCIFDAPESVHAMAKVKLQLANEESAKSNLGTAPHTPSTFILVGMDIEHIQRKLIYDVKEHKTPTALQQAQLQERRTSLRKRIKIFRSLQQEYMPGLRRVLRDPAVLDDATDVLAERIRLYLPSELSSGSHRDKACTEGLAAMEERLREADAYDQLGRLQLNLRTRTYLNKWRVKNVAGQRLSTRARSLQHRNDLKVHEAKSAYRHARKALLALRGLGSGPRSWDKRLRELKDEDVRALNERTLTEHEKAQREHRLKIGKPFDEDTYDGVPVDGTSGESRRTLSWIWMSSSGDEDSPEMSAALRVEWAKCKARQARWHEELLLLQEEMRRVIAFSYARAVWWRRKPEERPNVDDALAEGLRAYALEHADQETAFAVMLQQKWGAVRSRVETILAALAKPGFPEKGLDLTPIPVPVDVEADADADAEPGSWTAEEDQEAVLQAEISQAERIAIA
ncbi:hypothetical protein HWV62_13237 [Athelia sp. TMB]|nr:hypothetical protein HWV62_13237 [Athelia sp. TMB]